MSKSSFDNRISQKEFDKQISHTLAENKSLTAELKRKFTDQLVRETAIAKDKFGIKSPQYAEFQRSALAFATRYTADVANLDTVFDTLRTKAIESVSEEQSRVEKSTQAQFDSAQSLLSSKGDLAFARAINPTSVSKMLTGAEWEFQAYSPEERTRIGAKPFNMAQAQSWKETTFLLGAEFANSVKDIALFFTSIPGSIALLPRFAYLRANRHESMENEAMLAQMLKEFPALALVDLASDWDKAVLVLKELSSKIVSGKQEDVAFAIVNVVGLLAGGAVLGSKLSGSAAKLAHLASSSARLTSGKMAQMASTTTNAAVRASARVVATGTKWVAVGTLGVAGLATAGEVGLSRVAGIAGRIDNVTSGQFAVNAAANKVAKVAGWAQIGESTGLNKEGRMTKEESIKIAREKSNLSPLERVDGVEILLNIKLTPTQAAALEKAHNTQATNSKGIGQFSIGELRAKARILEKEGGFTPEQTRAIMENGYAGKMGDRFNILIEKGKLIFKRISDGTRDFVNTLKSPKARAKPTPEQMASAKSGAEDASSVDRTPATNETQDTLIGSRLATPTPVKASEAIVNESATLSTPAKAPEVVVDEKILKLAAPEVIADGVKALEAEFVRTPNRSDIRITNLEKYEAVIKEKILAKWTAKILSEAQKINEMMRGEYQEFSQAFQNSNILTYRVSSVDGKPFVEIQNTANKTWAPATAENTTAMRGQTLDNFNARIENEFRALQDRVITQKKPLLESAQKAKDAELIYANTYQEFSQAFQNSNALTYRVSSIDGKPFVEIQNAANKTWAPATAENTTAMRGQTLDNFNARIENEFRALQDRVITQKKPLLESAQKAKDAELIYANTYQEFSQAFQNSNILTYRVSSVDGKPFVEIQNTANKTWTPATAENTTAMRGQTLDNFNARIENEFRALLAKQKEAAIANPSVESLQKSLDQVQRLLAKERGRLTPDMVKDIQDAVKNWSNNGERRISQTYEIDKLIQDAAASANNLTTVDQARTALTEMTKNGKKNFLFEDNIKYEALRARMDSLSREGLVALGEDPVRVTDLIKTPEWRATLVTELEAVKNNNPSRWWLLLPLVLALGWCASSNRDGTGDGNTIPVVPPALDPNKSVATQLDVACWVDSKQRLSTLEEGRTSDAGAKLTTKTRESISRRWMRWAEWIALVKLVDNSEADLDEGFVDTFQAVKANPSIDNVQELQRWIGMDSIDESKGQDGILGPTTTGDITTFINACRVKNS